MPVRTPGTRVAYGSDSLQFGELRLPAEAGRAPVVVIIHGGCWFSPYASVRNSAPLAQALTDSGYATWNVEYRRYDQPGGGWPGTFLDVARGIDHLRVLARTHPVDTTRVVVIGHSAGGQLALWAASRKNLERTSSLYMNAPLAVHGVVSMGGITDLREYYTRQLETCGNPGVQSLLGAVPDSVPDRVRATSPIERVPLGVPTVLVAGERDRIATAASTAAYAAAARAAGDTVTVHMIPDEGHFEVVAPGRAASAKVITAVRALFAR